MKTNTVQQSLISVIVACYNEEQSIPIFFREICEIAKKLKKYDFEFIFIDDGSRDNTLKIIKSLNAQDKRVRFISFSRNFGKEAAMLAGLEYSNGDYVALMDADLQDPPSLLPEMIEILKNEEFDQVATRRISRKGEPIIRSFFSRRFYKIINRISDIEMVDGARDYRLMKRQVVNSIISLREYNRYSKGLFSFVGFNTKWLEYENIERAAGETKWSFWKLFIYAIDGIIAFSTAPLSIAIVLGILNCLLAFLSIIFIIVRTLAFGDPVSGWPSLVSIILFIGGVQLLCIGIIGQYLSRTYLETKRRPIYIIKETDKH